MQAPGFPVPATQPIQQQTQPLQYALPPAPTFASLGGTNLNLSGTLGSLAQVRQHGQPVQFGQGLSAAIPPSAYLMPQNHHLQQQQQQQQQQSAVKKPGKREDANFGLVLPLHKVKRLIKSENTVKAVSGEAGYGIARATELLLEQLLQRAYQNMIAENRASIEYEDIASAVNKWPATDFLKDIVPETMTLAELLEQVKQQEKNANPAVSKES